MPDGSRTLAPRDLRDPAALAAVYRAHSPYVFRVLRHCGVPDSDLDDAVQETFLVVFRRLPEFEARASLRTWIYAIAVRVAGTRRRSERREAKRRDVAGEQMHGTSTADPELALSRTEAAALVDRLLDELDAPKRTVFVLAELEGVKVPEISRILGVNPRTVHSRLRLARESFGSALRRERAREEGNLRVARRAARLRPRVLLEQAANDRPPAPRRNAVWAALAVRIEQGASPTLPGWESVALSSGAGAWVVPAAVIGAVASVMAVAAAASRPSPPPVSARPPSSVQSPTPRHEAAHASPRSSPPVVTATATDRTAPGEARIPTAKVVPRAKSDPRPSPTDRSAPASTAGLHPPAPSQPAPDHAPASASQPAPDHAPASASTLAAETLLLEQARSALRRNDPAAALVALDAHLAEFPRGLLRDEARSTRLRALCAAGRRDDATALAERLAPDQPGSRWHQVVAASCP